MKVVGLGQGSNNLGFVGGISATPYVFTVVSQQVQSWFSEGCRV